MQSAADTGDPAGNTLPPGRRNLVFAIVALALLMMSIDATIVATVLHTLQHGLGTTINRAGWTITAYALGFVLMLPVSGKLAQRHGNRRVLLLSVAVFTVASLCCGLADNIFLLIALRAVQAAGGAGITPAATGVIVNHFGAARDRGISLFGSITPTGAMIGPIFGGLLAAHWSWRAVFFVNVPVGIVVIVLGLLFVPRDPPRPREVHESMDFPGMALLGAALFAAMFGASYLGEVHARAHVAVAAIALAIAAAVLWRFFHHVGRVAEPFVLPRLIYGKGFGAANFVNIVYPGITAGAAALIPLYATNRYGIGVVPSGTLLVAQGVAAIGCSIICAMALRRTGNRLPLYAGGGAIACGMLLLALRPLGVSPWLWLAGAAFVIGIGSGTVSPPSRNAGLQLAPEQSATLAALRTVALQVGTIATVSIATALIAATGAEDGIAQAWFYVATALVIVAGMPLVVPRVPEHRGAW